MSSESSTDALRRAARELGFAACGVVEARPVDARTQQRYRDWIAHEGHADMSYLAANIEKRLDPTLLLPGARSIVVVALNYTPRHRLPAEGYQIAAYAYGRDYHDLLRERLRLLWQQVGRSDAEWKPCVDTVPFLERYWAVEAGLGFIGRHHQLIVPGAGSMMFLGAIVSTLAFSSYDHPLQQHCGTCQRCIDACPTHALSATEPFLSERCLSYQTIEHRGPFAAEVAPALGNTIYGCDRCQQVCPWNSHATPTTEPSLQPSDALLAMTRERWHTLSRDDYQQLFRGSAVKRAKYEGLMRNIEAARAAEE